MDNRWGKWKQVTSFIFLDSKITANGDYSHEIKRLFLLGRKAMTNLDSILKSRDIALPIARRNISNVRYADDTTLMAESEEELKSLLMKVKVKLLSRVRLFATPWTVAHQAPPTIHRRTIQKRSS